MSDIAHFDLCSQVNIKVQMNSQKNLTHLSQPQKLFSPLFSDNESFSFHIGTLLNVIIVLLIYQVNLSTSFHTLCFCFSY